MKPNIYLWITIIILILICIFSSWRHRKEKQRWGMSQEESGYLHELKETKLQATVDRMLYQLASEGLDLVTNFVITDGSKKAGFVDLLDNQPKVFFRNSDEKPG